MKTPKEIAGKIVSEFNEDFAPTMSDMRGMVSLAGDITRAIEVRDREWAERTQITAADLLPRNDETERANPYRVESVNYERNCFRRGAHFVRDHVTRRLAEIEKGKRNLEGEK